MFKFSVARIVWKRIFKEFKVITGVDYFIKYLNISGTDL